MQEIKDKTDKKARSLLLDNIRGFTVVLMIIFHFSFDLNYFGIVTFDVINHPFWYLFPRVIVFLFLFAVGMSLHLAHHRKIKWRSFLKRELLLIFWAGAISLGTYFSFRENWIYFGTLHAIALISLMLLPFLRFPKISLAIGLTLFFFSIAFNQNIPWFTLDHSSWDYISPFPWVGAGLLGIFASHKGLHKIDIPETKLTKSLNFLGNHSLFIYIVHQPILFGLILLFLKVIRS